MIRSTTLAAVLFAFGAPAGAQLCADLVLAEMGVDAFDASQQPVTVDRYEVRVTNLFDQDVTSIELSLPGDWVQADQTFRESPEFFEFLGSPFADSFFVTPDGVPAASILAADLVDDETLLQGALTIEGGGVFIAPGATETVAVLAVETGQVIDTTAFTGLSVVDGSLEMIGAFDPECIPEPGAALLAALGAVGLGARRHGV